MKMIGCLVLSLAVFCHCAGAEEAGSYHLGAIEVYGLIDPVALSGADEVFREQAQTFEKNSVADLLTLSPGISMLIGGRNEKNFTIRGFDQRQVSVFLDGIPVTQAFDGYTDLGLFDTALIDSVLIPKGHSSVLYGANTMGGTVNLLSARPENPFEGNIRGRQGSDSRFDGNFSLGTRQERFYAMLAGGLTDTDGYDLSDAYRENAVEDGGRRENSDQWKKTLYLKAGATPAGGGEYFIAYNRIEGEWGMPLRTTLFRPRYWRYSDWDKNTLYGVGDFQIKAVAVRARLFYDHARNVLDSYDDETYTTQTMGYAFHSTYEETSYGGSLMLSLPGRGRHLPSLALHYREDTHEQQSDYAASWEKYSSETWSVGIEEQLKLTRALSLQAGLGYDLVRPRHANGGPLRDDADAFNFSTGINYSVDETTRVHALFSGKSRFPTLKELYAESLDRSKIPNPDLHEETALNVEIGAEKTFGDSLIVRTALFYSRIEDLIANVDIDADTEQYRNIDSAEYRGLEFGLQAFVAEVHELTLNYTYLDARNTSANKLSRHLPDRPSHTLTLGELWNLTQAMSLAALLRAETGRYYQDWDGVYRLPGYAVFDLKARYAVKENFALEAGVKNVFDRNYFLDIGLPRAGRTCFAGVNVTF